MLALARKSASAGLVGIIVACGDGSTAPIGAARLAIVNSDADTSDVAVVSLLVSTADPYCSGTLIGPRAVVTAAHCLVESTVTKVGFDWETRAVAAQYTHPEFDHDTLTHDIGILTLTEDAPVAPIAMGTAPATGVRVRVAGYGIVAVDDRGTQRTRHYGFQRVESLTASSIRALPDPSSPCSHDSGGSLLSEDGRTLLGVISGGDATCSQYSDSSRIDAHRPFIDSVLSPAPAKSGCATAPLHRASNVSGALVAFLALTFAARRRQRRRSG